MVPVHRCSSFLPQPRSFSSSLVLSRSSCSSALINKSWSTVIRCNRCQDRHLYSRSPYFDPQPCPKHDFVVSRSPPRTTIPYTLAHVPGEPSWQAHRHSLPTQTKSDFESRGCYSGWPFVHHCQNLGIENSLCKCMSSNEHQLRTGMLPPKNEMPVRQSDSDEASEERQGESVGKKCTSANVRGAAEQLENFEKRRNRRHSPTR